MPDRRLRLSYANVMSTIAVFIALGGTSYAVARNSVGTAQLRANAVTSAKVKSRSLRVSDLSPSARVGRRGPRGAQGPAGAQGPSGVPGGAEAWHPLELINGWGLFDAGHERAGYRKDRDGVVHLRGMLTLTTGVPAGAVVIAVLPPGYRPELRNIFVVTSGEPPFAARIFIDPNGAITWNGNAANEKDYTSLSGVSFWPE